MPVRRFGVSLDEEYLKELDQLVQEHRFPNRSQAIRYLISKAEVEKKWSGDEEVAGAIILVYDHHRRELQNHLTHIQHDYHCLVLSTQHIHLDHDHCLETIAVKGKASKLVKLADKLKACKGIRHGELVMTMT